MKGFVFLDSDEKLQIRTKEFIDSHPEFFGRNRHNVSAYWEFDTDDRPGMVQVLHAFKRRQLPSMVVNEFCEGAGVDLSSYLKKRVTNEDSL